ncbi:MAG: FAD-dependent monooxygenase [Gammaproteobacteria bacterium]|nr:FAD-dependent monooxygenase [Gammaproteobacteria bacterium]
MQDNIVDILIVGAGPSGLILACALAKNGIKFRIIDKRHSSSDIPRAININNAALAIFEKLNIDKQFWKAGLKLDELTAYWNQKRILNLNYKYIEADYPYFYHLEQSKIEQYLIDLLQKMGITVDREVSLVGLEQ